MKRIATLTGSLLVALAGTAGAQQRAPASINDRVRALVQAGDDAAAREKALEALDTYPLANLTSFPSYAERQGPAAKEAVRRWLPHRAWVGNLNGTVGDARRKEIELLGPDAKREPDGFARAVEGLLDRPDAATRVLALRLLKGLPLRNPEKLLPFLEGEDRPLRRLASEALLGRAGPDVADRVLASFLSGGPDSDAAVGRLLASIGGPAAVPALLELADAQPARAPAALRIVGAIGDASAEPGLLARLEKSGSPDATRAALDALALVGTTSAIAPIRKVRDADPSVRASAHQALLALRDPALAREIVDNLRTGRADLRAVGGELTRLGARDAVPHLVETVGGRIKIEERNRILESLGHLGGPSEVERILPYLEDERHVEAAAAALYDLGDPRAAGPLARALRMAKHRSIVGRALLALPPPLEGTEEALLEILEDPDGHSSYEDALRVAARVRSAKIKEKVLLHIPTRGWAHTSVWEALPMLQPEDRATLLQLRPEAKPAVTPAVQLALAATGDAEALKALILQASSQRFSLRHPYDRERLLEFPGLAAAIEEGFKSNPGWIEGAEWLAHHGNRAGAALLRDQLKTQPDKDPVLIARALLRLNDPEARDALLEHYERNAPGELPLGGGAAERAFARSLEDAAAARLRHALASASPVRAPLRLLAHRADPAAVAYFRSQLYAAWFGSEEIHVASAFAEAGAVSLRPDFLRMLRSTHPSRRIAGARSLGLLGDRTAIPLLVPYLDDLQSVDLGTARRQESTPRAFSSVSEAAADAIERLAGREFPGPRAKRIEAIRAWAAEQR